jgi:hypothetical protein
MTECFRVNKLHARFDLNVEYVEGKFLFWLAFVGVFSFATEVAHDSRDKVVACC